MDALSRGMAGRDPNKPKMLYWELSEIPATVWKDAALVHNSPIYNSLLDLWDPTQNDAREPIQYRTRPRATSLEGDGSLQLMLPFAVVSDHDATTVISRP